MTHGHLMSRNAQQPTLKNSECRNQTMTVKHRLDGGIAKESIIFMVTWKSYWGRVFKWGD